MHSKILISLFISCLYFWSSDGVASQARIALVIGNASYVKGELKTASADVQQLTQKLESAGFDVLSQQNVSFYDLRILVEEFGNLAEESELALFFYAGHAIQLKAVSYLIPVDVNLRNRGDLQKLTWLDEVVSAGSRATNFVGILDTCRNTRHAEGWGDRFGREPVCGNSDEIARNLPDNSVIAFVNSVVGETQATISPDGPSDYSNTLMAQIRPEVDVVAVLENTRKEVQLLSGNQQNPVFYGQLASKIAFHAPPPEPVKPEPAPTQAKTQTQSPDTRFEKLPVALYRIKSVQGQNILSLNDQDLLAVTEQVNQGGRSGWDVLDFQQGYGIRNSQSGYFLSYDSESDNISMSESWSPSASSWVFEVAAGDPEKEFKIKHLNSSRYLVSEVSGAALGLSPTAPQAGWLLSVITDDEKQLDTTEIVADGENALAQVAVAPTLSTSSQDTAQDSNVITEEERIAVLKKLVGVKNAIAAGDKDLLLELLPPSPTRSLYVQLLDQYQKIDIELTSSSSSRNAGQISGVLRINEMILANGDKVLPASSYKDTTLSSKRVESGEWSRLY